MKIIQTSFFRAIAAIIVGALLIKYRQETVTWLTISIGVLFFLSGLISCIVYFGSKKSNTQSIMIDENGNDISNDNPSFPIAGMGSLILGICLALAPTMVLNWTLYILGAILILGALGQFFSLATIVRLGRVGAIFWFMPCVVFIIGLIAIVRPNWLTETPLFILGWTMVLYGVIECVNAFKIMNIRRRVAHAMKLQEKAEAATVATQHEDEPQSTEVKEPEAIEQKEEEERERITF